MLSGNAWSSDLTLPASFQPPKSPSLPYNLGGRYWGLNSKPCTGQAGAYAAEPKPHKCKGPPGHTALLREKEDNLLHFLSSPSPQECH